MQLQQGEKRGLADLGVGGQCTVKVDFGLNGLDVAAFGLDKSQKSGDDRYVVPGLVEELTTPQVLAMDWIDGVPVEQLADEPQEQRDRVMGELIELVLRELFEFGVMQTDPNFANYLYQTENLNYTLQMISSY